MFRWLVQEYGTYIYRVTYSVLHDAKEAEDAAQETFLQIYKSLPEYRSQGLKTWMTRIAVNKAIDLEAAPRPPQGRAVGSGRPGRKASRSG